MKSTLLLTSTGLSAPSLQKKFIELISDNKNFNVAIITTASEGKEHNKYSILAKEQLQSYKFKDIDFIDIEFDQAEKLKEYNLIYVCGGNTFYLLDKLKISGADKVLTEILLENQILYIGVSAGSIIVTPTIRIANTVQPDPNNIGLIDFSALGIVEFEIQPHYDLSQENEIKAYEEKYNTKVERINNQQGIYIHDGLQLLIS